MEFSFSLYQADFDSPRVFLPYKEEKFVKGAYQIVNAGVVSADSIDSALEYLFCLYNEKPAYTHRSMSVSDVIVLDGSKAFYTEGIGFTDITDVWFCSYTGYELDHWEQYHITSTKEDFIKLLNILESHDESLESLHETVTNGEQVFCRIFNHYGWGSSQKLATVLLERYALFTDLQFFNMLVNNDISECGVEASIKALHPVTTTGGLLVDLEG